MKLAGRPARPRNGSKATRAAIRKCRAAIAAIGLLSGCGSPSDGHRQTQGKMAPAGNSAGVLFEAVPMTQSGSKADALTMSAHTLVCGRVSADPALGPVAGGLETGFLNIVFDRMRGSLPRLGLTANAAGDSSGSRFRHLAGGRAGCAGEGDILVTLGLVPGPAGAGDPPAGRPAILPYRLTLVVEQGSRRWTKKIVRSRHEAHAAVTNDPRTRSPVAATRASIVLDLTETGNQLAQSLKGTEQ